MILKLLDLVLADCNEVDGFKASLPNEMRWCVFIQGHNE